MRVNVHFSAQKPILKKNVWKIKLLINFQTHVHNEYWTKHNFRCFNSKLKSLINNKIQVYTVLDFYWNLLLRMYHLKCSTIVNEVIRTISSLFIFFFLQKIFQRTKTQIKQKSINRTKISKQKTTKATIFCVYKNF